MNILFIHKIAQQKYKIQGVLYIIHQNIYLCIYYIVEYSENSFNDSVNNSFNNDVTRQNVV